MGASNSCNCVNVFDDDSLHRSEIKGTNEYLLMKKIIKIQAVIKAFLFKRRYQKLKIKIYNDRVNSLLNQFFKDQIGKFQKVEPFDFRVCDDN